MKTAPYVLLHARSRGEHLNAGVILFTEEGPLVAITPEQRRLAILHPDFAAVNLDGWAKAVTDTFRSRAPSLPNLASQITFLSLLTRPFFIDEEPLMTRIDDEDAQVTLRELMNDLVLTPRRRIAPARSPVIKKHTRLHVEIKTWLRSAKAFSAKVEDLSKNKVVANYPIDPNSDLYADFALMNGKLHVMETLDLRGLAKMTTGIRGEAAVKGITLDEAKDRIGDGKCIGIVSASDYGTARGTISIFSRYADDLFDMGTPSDRQRLADFITTALHRTDFPQLEIATLTGYTGHMEAAS